MAARAFLADDDEQALALAAYVMRVVAQPPPVVYTDGLPRVAFSDAVGKGTSTAEGEAALVSALRDRSFVVLTGVAQGARLYRALERELMGFFNGSHGGCGSAAKAACVGGVYVNERDVPMWSCGYEHVEDRVREAFRVHAQAGSDLIWPCSAVQDKWQELVAFCQSLADSVLALALEAKDARSVAAARAARADTLASFEQCRRAGGDFGVAYALHYPNDEGGAPTLPLAVTSGEAGICVKAHIDPSLVVLEPVADVPGLDVKDALSGEWVSVERSSQRPGEEWVVFGGRCLEAATGIKACVHRVTASNHGHEDDLGRRRFCFIYEQKLGDFYDGC